MKKTIITILAIIAIIAVLYYGYKYYQSSGTKKVSGGSAPTQDEIACASGGTVSGKIIGVCTKPKAFPVPPGIKEKCFTSDQLGLTEGDTGYDVVTDSNGFGEKWYFNYQSGDKFCYTDKKI